MSPRSQQTIFDLAEEAGAKTCSKSRRLGRTLLKSRQPQMPAAAGLVICVGENAPRDLDDPFSDPEGPTPHRTVHREVRGSFWPAAGQGQTIVNPTFRSSVVLMAISAALGTFPVARFLQGTWSGWPRSNSKVPNPVIN